MAEPAEVLRRVEQLRTGRADIIPLQRMPTEPVPRTPRPSADPGECAFKPCQRPARRNSPYCSDNCWRAASKARRGLPTGLPLASRRYAELLELERIYREGGLKP